MSGRVVIVTGASSGIGEATARAFVRAGDYLVLAARRVERLHQLAAQLPVSLVVQADLTRSADIARIVDDTVREFGRIDVLVNNAGLGRYDWLERLPEEDIRNEILVNLVAPMLLTKAVLPVMQAQHRGVIINLGSVAGRIGAPTMSIYNATKFGLDGFSQALRREVGPQGIDVCVIYPGGVAGTEFGREAKRVNLGVTTPAWLRLTADQVGAAIVGLADRPRPRLVMPWLFRTTIAINTFLPSVVDAVMMRTARRARAGTSLT